MDSKNGDFVSLVSQDFTDLEINLSEEEIQEMSNMIGRIMFMKN